MQTSISPSRSKSALDERSRLCVCVERRIYWSWLSLPGWRSLLHDHRHRWMSASRLCIFRLSIKLFRQHGWTQLASSSHLCILCSYSSIKTPVRVSMLCIYNCRTLYGLLSCLSRISEEESHKIFSSRWRIPCRNNRTSVTVS